MSLEHYLDTVLSEGAWESAGAFTTDWLRAEQTMADFYRAQPALWMLNLVQAAVAAGGTEIAFKTGRNHVLMGFNCEQPPPLPEQLLVEGEVARYLKVAIQAALACEPELERLTLATWSQGSPAEAICFCPNQPPRSGPLTPEKTIDLQQRMGWKADQPHHLVVLFERRQSGWWQGLSRRIRFFVSLQTLFRERLLYCPVPIVLDAWSLGQGTGRAYPAIAAEYLVGPLETDVFVKELEPGNGSRVYDVFGEWVGKLGVYPRLLVRWAEIDHPLFPRLKPALEAPLSKFHKRAFSTVLGDRDSLPPRSLGIFGRGFWGFYLHSWVQFNPEFRPPAPPNSMNSAGLPTRVLLILPPTPRGISQIVILRRGVGLENIEVDLGCPGAIAMVACPALSTDLSGMRIVQDDRYQELLEFLRQRLQGLLRDAARAAQQEKVSFHWPLPPQEQPDPGDVPS